MQNLSNNPVPQWKIKYDSQFNVQPQQNVAGGNIDPENSVGKTPWLSIIIGGLIIVGFVTATLKSQQQTHQKKQPT
jgi:hypothetical protein